MLNARKHLHPLFHGEYVTLTISQQQLQSFVKYSKPFEEQL